MHCAAAKTLLVSVVFLPLCPHSLLHNTTSPPPLSSWLRKFLGILAKVSGTLSHAEFCLEHCSSFFGSLLHMFQLSAKLSLPVQKSCLAPSRGPCSNRVLPDRVPVTIFTGLYPSSAQKLSLFCSLLHS